MRVVESILDALRNNQVTPYRKMCRPRFDSFIRSTTRLKSGSSVSLQSELSGLHQELSQDVLNVQSYLIVQCFGLIVSDLQLVSCYLLVLRLIHLLLCEEQLHKPHYRSVLIVPA